MLNLFDNVDLADKSGRSVSKDICSKSSLYAAWRKVWANRGAGGIDDVTLGDFESNLSENLGELSRNLTDGTYRPLPVRFVNLYKPNGRSRELGILCVRDRIAQRAVLDAVEHRFESEMHDCSFAFRVGRNVEMAIHRILVSRANGFWWTFESDIEDYFGSINRDSLIQKVSRIVADEKLVRLIRLWLEAGVLEGAWLQSGSRTLEGANAIVREAIVENIDEFVNPRYDIGDMPFSQADLSPDLPASEDDLDDDSIGRTRRNAVKSLIKRGLYFAVAHRSLIASVFGSKLLGIGAAGLAGMMIAPKVLDAYRRCFHPQKGILQGSPISPVLANFYLNDFDRAFSGGESQLVRYCDDFVILSTDETGARNAMLRAERELSKLGLRLHPDKTRLLSPSDEFEFLGYRFLSDGTVEPPPTATEDMAKKIRNMSVQVADRFRHYGRRFKVKKITVTSWKEYFNRFGKSE